DGHGLSQKIDPGANGSQWIFQLMRDNPDHLVPRLDRLPQISDVDQSSHAFDRATISIILIENPGYDIGDAAVSPQKPILLSDVVPSRVHGVLDGFESPLPVLGMDPRHPPPEIGLVDALEFQDRFDSLAPVHSAVLNISLPSHVT